MMLRLKHRFAAGLIVSTIGMTCAALAVAADNAPGMAPGASTAGSQAPMTGASTPAATGGATSSPSSAADTTMAPRGADPAQTTNTASTPASPKDSPAKKIFDQLDLNHDGMLSLDEFSRATFQQPGAK
jgi:hypothetical protein